MNAISAARWALELVLLLVIAWALTGFVQYARVAPPGFDGAMNLNTAVSFLHGHGYGFFYGEFFPFPAQTDGPLTLPAAMLMRWGGVTPLTTQGVNLAYLIGAVSACFLLVRRITRSSVFGLLGAAIFLMTPGLAIFSMGGFGEIPMLFWFLLSLLILAPTLNQIMPSRLRLALGGITLALCYLTKIVALLLVAPATALFVVMFGLRQPQLRRLLPWFAAGLAIPIICWEIFRLTDVGGLHGYLLWWRLQVGEALHQSGAHETLHSTGYATLTKVEQHFGVLSEQSGTPIWALVCFLLVPWFVWVTDIIARWRQRDVAGVFCLGACGAISGLYFIWWLAIEQSEMAWFRRILDGLLLQQILLVTAAAALAGACRSGIRPWPKRRSGAAIMLVVLLIPEVFLVRSGQTLTNPPAASALDLDTLALANKVRRLPADATLFGFGWWKNPVLALFSGRSFDNYYYWDPAKIDALPHKYLVLDFSARMLAQPAAHAILMASTYRTLADGPGGAIYELDKVLPYPPFTNADRDPAKLRSGFNAADGAYAATRGFYSPEGTSVWAKPDAALLLRRTDQTRLILSFYIPPQIKTDETGVPLLLHVSSPKCMDAWLPIRTGAQTVSVPLSCPPPAQPDALEISLHLNAHVPPVRQIDADQRRLGFFVTDIHLQ